MINPIMSELVEIVLQQAEDEREGYSFLNDLLGEMLKRNLVYELARAIEEEAEREGVCYQCGGDEFETVTESLFDIDPHVDVEIVSYKKCMRCGLELDY